MPRSTLPAAGLATALALAITVAPGASAQAPTEPRAADAPRSLELLDATLWMQHAAERRAACLQTFALATERLGDALGDRTWTAIPSPGAGYESLPPAVILDVDETLLDNHWFEARLILEQRVFDLPGWSEWCAEAAATPVPGAVAFCQAAAALGVEVFYVTNRRADVAEATRANLARYGFPFSDDRTHLLPRAETADKTARRRMIAARYRVLLLVGDNGGDFHEDLGRHDVAERQAAVDRHAIRWGRSWIMLPNPMYGDWLGALIEYSWETTPEEQREVLLQQLAGTSVDEAGAGQPAGLPRALASVVTAELGDVTPVAARPGATAHDHGSEPAGSEHASPEHDAQDDPASWPGPARHPLLRSGPMAGWSSTTTASVWLQTLRPASVHLRAWPLGSPDEARLVGPVSTSTEGDLVAQLSLTGLAPGSELAYELFLDGERVAAPWPLRLATRPVWRWRGPSGEQPHAPSSVSLLLGSCFYVNDLVFDRPGETYGGGFEILQAMADEQADLTLWLGDNVYLRGDDWSSETGIRARYAHTRQFPGLQRLLGTGSHLAIWDDHDYGPNDSDRGFALADAAREVFADYWPSRVLGQPDAPGVFRQVTWEDLDLFLLDDRSFRSPNDAAVGPDKVMYGERQMAWLRDALLGSSATFKVIAGGGQMLNPVVNFEGWAEFPAERAAFLDFLEQEAIEGVFFLSGDRHQSELIRLERQGMQDLFELTCSPLTAGFANRDLDGEHDARVTGTWTGQRNYARIDIEGPWGQRVLNVSLRDAGGDELWSWSLKQR
jgi:alkaline phosphatase D